MDKLTYLQALDAESVQTLISNYIEKIHELACESNKIRFERRDHPVDGVIIALEARETKLKAEVQAALEGVRSNEDTRSTMLATKKLADEGYKTLMEELNSINMALDQNRIDTEYFGNCLQSALQALRFKTASLRFLAEE